MLILREAYILTAMNIIKAHHITQPTPLSRSSPQAHLLRSRVRQVQQVRHLRKSLKLPAMSAAGHVILLPIVRWTLSLGFLILFKCD